MGLSLRSLIIIGLVALLVALGVIGLGLYERQSRREVRLQQDQAFVLAQDATVEDVAEDGSPSKCLLAKGDCIKIDEVGPEEDDPTVVITYAPVVDVNPAEDRRCATGTSVYFTETGVKNMIGK